jgi:hypothetical protein
MTPGQRVLLVLAYALALSAFVGVLSIALHTPSVIPGMGVAFALAVFTGVAGTSRRGAR